MHILSKLTCRCVMHMYIYNVHIYMVCQYRNMVWLKGRKSPWPRSYVTLCCVRCTLTLAMCCPMKYLISTIVWTPGSPNTLSSHPAGTCGLASTSPANLTSTAWSTSSDMVVCLGWATLLYVHVCSCVIQLSVDHTIGHVLPWPYIVHVCIYTHGRTLYMYVL